MLLYRCLLTLATPFLVLALLIRVLRGIETRADLRERLGLWRTLPKANRVWCHAASNGELAAARPVIEALARENALLISCNSISGKEMAKGWGLAATEVRLAPIDLKWLQSRVTNKAHVEKFVLFEADFWPNRITTLAQHGIPTALIGGRISEKSAKGWGRFNGLAKRVFSEFDMIAAQDAQSAKRLEKLGACKDAFGPAISLKSLYAPTSNAKAAQDRHLIWLAASTHEGEDDILLLAHQTVLQTNAETRLILAPRHPKRGDDVTKIAKSLGLNTTQRSKGDAFEATSQVYIADTLGEMDKWYAQAGICFVAGSLVPKGGHTPFEPLAYDCALLHGPHLENFAEPYAELHKHQGAVLCIDAAEIARNVLSLQNPNEADRQRNNARTVTTQNDVLGDVLSALQNLSKN